MGRDKEFPVVLAWEDQTSGERAAITFRNADKLQSFCVDLVDHLEDHGDHVPRLEEEVQEMAALVAEQEYEQAIDLYNSNMGGIEQLELFPSHTLPSIRRLRKELYEKNL